MSELIHLPLWALGVGWPPSTRKGAYRGSFEMCMAVLAVHALISAWADAVNTVRRAQGSSSERS